MRRISGVLILSLAALVLAAPASAESVQADVDGDGVLDTVVARAIGDYGVGVSVELDGSGSPTSEQQFENAFVYEPWLWRVRDVDGRAGAELFVHTGHITTYETITVMSVVNGTLVRSGRLIMNAGLADDYAMGFRCRRVRGGPGIVAYDFSRQSPGHWRRRARSYRWKDGRLVRVGPARHSVVRHPSAGERKLGC
jgi:hypothetical protein